jgi:hypothetical protein
MACAAKDRSTHGLASRRRGRHESPPLKREPATDLRCASDLESRARKGSRNVLASREPLIAGFAAVVDASGLRLGAVGERAQKEENFRVPVLRHQPRDVVAPASATWLTNDR